MVPCKARLLFSLSVLAEAWLNRLTWAVGQTGLRSHSHYTEWIWKRRRIKCFPSTLGGRNFNTRQKSPVDLDLCLKNLVQGNHVIIVTSWFSNSYVLKWFPSSRIRKFGVFKFFRFEERFWKALFSWRISVDGRPNCRNKAAFSYFSSVVWRLPKKTIQKFYL